MKKLCFFLFIIFSLSTIAQSKKEEVEQRISREKMPLGALQILDLFKDKKFKKQHYFFEKDGNKESFEAKFIYNKSAYSVEFSPKGKLEDVEVVIKKQQIAPKPLDKIESFLKDNFDAFKIVKVQKQFKNGIAKVVFEKSLLPTNHPDNFELIVQIRLKGSYYKYEFLFDANGDYKEKRKVVKNQFDYLIF